MVDQFLVAAAIFIFVITTAAIIRLLFANTIERLMAVQLLGTGSAAVLLLLGYGLDEKALTDVALLTMLFSAFSSIGFSLRPKAHRSAGGAKE